MITIDGILSDTATLAAANEGVVDWDSLKERLTEREEAIVGLLHLAAAQFGMYPQIVAKILMDVGLGSPPEDAVRTMINNQFAALMEEIRRQFNENNEG